MKNLASFSLKLFQLRHEWRNLLMEVLEEYDITVEEWLILASLERAKNGLSMTELSAEQGMQMSGVSKNVDKLSSRALVYRQKDPQDNRRVMIHLSDFGNELLEDVAAGLKSHQARFRRETANDRWRDIVEYLDKA